MKHSGLERCVLSRSIKKVTHQSNYFLHFLAIKVYENNSIVCYVFLVEGTFIYCKYIFYYYFRHHEHFESKRVRRSIWILTFIIFDHLHFCHNYRTCDHLYEREKKDILTYYLPTYLHFFGTFTFGTLFFIYLFS